MRVGDRVRLLRGTEEGRIVNIKNNKIVDIEIEDGFIIPALINEVVVVSSSEAEVFQTEEHLHDEPKATKQHEDYIAEGVYLGFQEKKDNTYKAYIINQTPTLILFSISQYDKKVVKGKSYGVCEDYNSCEIGNFTSSIFNEAKKLSIQILTHQQETLLLKQPQTFELSLKKEQLSDSSFLSSLSGEVALIKLGDEPISKLDPEELKNRMMEKYPKIEPKKEVVPKSSEATVDLHFDSFTSGLNPNEILDYQLNEFEKAYDNALVMNIEKLKVIHGLGAGILRNEIHKRLSKKLDVKYFEDADKERFGFGSTIIYF